MKNIFILLFVAFCSVAIFNSCKDSGTNSEDKLKDPREMTWTADTLSYPNSIQTLMTGFLAFSNKDIFAYGHCDWSAGKVYHYDGIKWDVYDLTPYIYGYWVNKMIAFSRNNIYGVGSSGDPDNLKVFNYNGTSWKYYMPAEYILGALYSVAGDPPNNIYACGTNGLIYYYNGDYWKKEIINVKIPSNTSFDLISIAVYNNVVWTIADARNANTNYFRSFLIKGTTGNWTVQDSVNTNASPIIANRGLFRVFLGDNKKFYSSGTRGYYSWDGNKWTLLYNDTDNYHFYVYNDNYMISFGGVNAPKYYDGSSWYNFYSKLPGNEDIEFKDAWFDGKELFIIGLTINQFPEKTIIYHGR